MKRKIWTGILVLFAATTLSAGIYFWWLLTPPPMPTNAQEAVAVLQSARLARLPGDRQEPYIEKTRQIAESLDDAQRRELWKNLRQDRQATRRVVETYILSKAEEFVCAEPFKRQQMLDAVIAMQEINRQRAQTRPAREGLLPGDRDFRAHMQDRIEHGNPQRQAYMMEFFKALRERRKQLGLDPDPPPPRR